MAPAIHFTHHLCRQLDGAVARPDNDTNETDPHRRWPHERAPEFHIPTSCWSRNGRRNTGCFTTEERLVTCRHCIRFIAREHAHRDRFKPWPDTGELVRRAWLTCCRDRGAPCPFNAAEIAAFELERRRDQIKVLARLDIEVCGSILAEAGVASAVRAKLGKLVTSFDADVIDLARPMVNEWLLAGDLLVELEGCFARVAEHAKGLRDRVEAAPSTEARAA